MKYVLITGAAGFIGSHLAESLIKEGDFVVGLDNFVTGTESNVERLKKAAEKSNGGFEFHKFDVTDGAAADFLAENYETIDRVYHLACPASPKDFENLGVEILEVCSKGTMNILALAEKKHARFLLASTSEVYGDPLVHPQTENYFGNVNSIGKRSCYDEGKRFAESYTVNYCAKHSVDFRIARIFNTYGPYMKKDDGRVIPNFIEQMKQTKPLTIYGDGSQTRSFCYIDDMVKGLKLLMEYNGFDESVNRSESIIRVFNLGNPSEITILELAKNLCEVANVKLQIETKAVQNDDPKRRMPNIETAKRILGFQPNVNLQDGLKQTLTNWN